MTGLWVHEKIYRNYIDMSKENKISKKINEHKSISTNPSLSWDAIGEDINKGVAEKRFKKRRKRVLIWLCFVGVCLFMLYGIGLLLQEEKTMSAVDIEQLSSIADVVQSEAGESSIAVVGEDMVKVSEDLSRVDITDIDNNQKITQEYKFTSVDAGKTKVSEVVNKSYNAGSNISNSNSQSVQRYNLNAVGNFNNIEEAVSENNIEKTLLGGVTNVANKRFISSIAKDRALLDDIKYSPVKFNFISTDIRSIEPLPFEDSFDNETSKHKRYYSFQVGMNQTNIGDNYALSSSELGYSVEVLAHWNVYDNIYLGTGVGYNSLNFKSEFESVRDLNIFKPNTPDTLFYFNSELVHTVAKDSIGAQEIRRFRNYNSVSIISIPFQLSYIWEYKKLHFIPAVGGSLNVWSRASGRVTDNFYNTSEFESWGGSSVSLWGQMGVGFRINDNSSIVANYRWARYGATNENSIIARSSRIQWISKF